MTHWKLEWITIGEETENKDDSVVMGGIVPDGAKAMRGQTVLWPYNDDGSFSHGYMMQATVLMPSNSGPYLLSKFLTRILVEKILSEHGG